MANHIFFPGKIPSKIGDIPASYVSLLELQRNLHHLEGIQLGIQGVHMGTFSISCGLQWFLKFSTINLVAVVSNNPMASPTQKNTNKPLAIRKHIWRLNHLP